MDFKLNNVVSMWKVREMVDKATNLVMNYTDTEAKVSDTVPLKFCGVKHNWLFPHLIPYTLFAQLCNNAV